MNFYSLCRSTKVGAVRPAANFPPSREQTSWFRRRPKVGTKCRTAPTLVERIQRIVVTATLFAVSACQADPKLPILPAPPLETITETVEIAPVWAGHPVGFFLLTHENQQFVAFYDANRAMTIGQRTLGDKSFKLTTLPSKVAWDSHNAIVMAVDKDGVLHVAGNMHVRPLVYFRSEKPLDASSLKRVPNMTGELENRVTYPVFSTAPSGGLMFAYRHGSSGDGIQIYNLYDTQTKTWRRLLDKPLFDGEGLRNAYPISPTLGPDGFYHVVWIWRETTDAKTNNNPSYARSRDLLNWENSRGEKLELPITLAQSDIVDPIPAGGGAINGNVKIGFDAQKRPVVSYHKYDARGFTQIYNARLEDGKWAIRQASNFKKRWEFGGGGSIPFDVRVGEVQADADGKLTQFFRFVGQGTGFWVLDPQTLKPIALQTPPELPPAIQKIESDFPKMQIMRGYDNGTSGQPNARYVLKWETLPSNRDLPREPPFPAPSTLRVYRLENRPLD